MRLPKNILSHLAWIALLLQLCATQEHAQEALLAPSGQPDKQNSPGAIPPIVTKDLDATSVRDARDILEQIQPSKVGLVRLAKSKGFIGASLHYSRVVFDLLFLNTPTKSADSPTRSSASSAKLEPQLERAVILLENAAKSESPNAIWLLAEMNFYGNYSHPRNYTSAFDYYRQLAALNGNASAQHMLGFMYATGIGGAVEKDQARALLYHTFAADAGDVRSQMTAGYRHLAGVGTPRNCETAVKYYKQAARKSIDFYKSGPPGGHVLTRNAYRLADEVGGVYGEGASVSSSGHNAKTGGPTSDVYADIEDVLEYLQFQSRKGDLRASFNLAKLYYDGSRGMERDMKAAKKLFMQIARMFWTASGKINTDASKTVERLAPKAAGNLGRMFLRGEGMEQSYEKAMIWFKRGIEYGDVLSQYSVGVMYMQGLGVPKDPLRAASYLGPAADNDMAVAQTDLGALFLDQGDAITARSYFDLAIQAGHIEAYYYLAEMADQGLGRDRSCSMAAAFYKISAEKAEVMNAAFIEANEAYERGDKQTALTAYMMAAEQGYENAQANVAWILDQTRSQNWISHVFQTLMDEARGALEPLLPAVVKWASDILKAVPGLRSAAPSSASDATLSLIYYTRSAKQNNMDSLLKAGDMHLAGIGGTPSAENAAFCYSAAADLKPVRAAQAMWNLGWMYETGIGVEKDYHLAKRYYDLAAATNDEAYLPVQLSLLQLRLKSWWNGVSGGAVRGIQSDDDEDGDGTSKSKRKRGFWEWVNEFIDAELRLNDAAAQGFYDDDDEGWNDERAMQRRQDQLERGGGGAAEGGGAGGVGANDFPGGGDYVGDGLDPLDDGLLESLGIISLAAILAALVYWRQQRVRRGNEAIEAERRAALRGGAGHPAPDPAAAAQPPANAAAAYAQPDPEQRRQQQEEQAQQLQQQQQQVFPAPDDPDFAPWAANGVWH